MKRSLLLILLAGGLGFASAAWMVSRWHSDQYKARQEALQAAWEQEKLLMEEEIEHARQEAHLAQRPVISAPETASSPAIKARPSPEEIMAKLQALSLGSGNTKAPTLRQVVYWLEELAQLGPEAFPAIGDFLARYEDVELDTSLLEGRNARNRVPLNFVLPPSLRFGLFDVLRRQGGAEAERILAQSLVQTGRGVEVAYLARVLEAMAPNIYRTQALTTARALLADTSPLQSKSPLDRYHRDHLYGVLSLFGDNSFAGQAQQQLVSSDSRIDRSALKYLQQTLGTEAVPIVTQAYQNPALTNSAGKEPLARLALDFVGADARANDFYEQAINDPLLTRSHRKNLIEDLNQDGFQDTRNLTAKDLPLIENRMTLIEQLAPTAMDDANAAAFAEAYKDLVNMRAKIQEQSFIGN